MNNETRPTSNEDVNRMVGEQLARIFSHQIETDVHLRLVGPVIYEAEVSCMVGTSMVTVRTGSGGLVETLRDTADALDWHLNGH